MCEVGSCCGCISLYRGCIIIGFVTMVVGVCNIMMFGWLLFVTYTSFAYTSGATTTSFEPSFGNASSGGNATEEGEASYSFSSSLCPFGFVPLTSTKTNETAVAALTASPDLADPTGVFNFTGANSTLGFNATIEISRVSCIAPGQGVLWSLVSASGLYMFVGIFLICGVKKGVSWMLSTWFFYTVGYNLLGLIVALTDGVYTSPPDISSYLTTLVTAYCIIVVDSYYEKVWIASSSDSKGQSLQEEEEEDMSDRA